MTSKSNVLAKDERRVKQTIKGQRQNQRKKNKQTPKPKQREQDNIRTKALALPQKNGSDTRCYNYIYAHKLPYVPAEIDVGFKMLNH